jgi:enediyne biosynthesis protein E4
MVRRFTRRDFLNYAAMAAAAPIFEVKPLRGLDFILQNSPTPRKFLIETMPGGVALFDYNNDGLLDILLVNGGKITEFVSPESRRELYGRHTRGRPG